MLVEAHYGMVLGGPVFLLSLRHLRKKSRDKFVLLKARMRNRSHRGSLM